MSTSNETSISSSVGNIVLITGTTINLVLGVPIHSWVLWMVLTGPTGTMASEFFTLNLSVCDMLFSLLHLPGAIKHILPLELFTCGLLFTGRAGFQTCIGVERFMAVVHPVLFLKYKPLRYRVACSALAWLVIIGASLLYMMVGFSKISRYVFLGEYLFFMSVMVFCSLAVLRVLKQPKPGEMGREGERDNNMKRRAFIIICLTMVSFVGTVFIWSIFTILADHGLIDDFTLAIGICIFITVVTGFVQPLLYLCQKTGKLPCVKPIQDT